MPITRIFLKDENETPLPDIKLEAVFRDKDLNGFEQHFGESDIAGVIELNHEQEGVLKIFFSKEDKQGHGNYPAPGEHLFILRLVDNKPPYVINWYTR